MFKEKDLKMILKTCFSYPILNRLQPVSRLLCSSLAANLSEQWIISQFLFILTTF